MRHFAKAELTLLVLIVIMGGVCQKAPAPAQPVATPGPQPTASSTVLPTLAGRDFYVAPTGSPAGDGSLDNPWDLPTALNQPSAVHPGDKIWLRGGTYRGKFNSSLTGTSSAPITVRQYPSERATLDGGNTSGAAILTVQGAYTWYWGFEIMSSDPNRVSATDLNDPPDIHRGDGIDMSSGTGSGLKFINLVIHDARQGIGWWKEAIDSEIYGCLIYYNGWESTARGSGHGIYAQNQTGTKKITDNVIFSGFGYGIHAYGSSKAFLDNFLLQGNTLFNSGDLSPSGPSAVLLVGGGSVAHNPQILGNYLYRQTTGDVSDFDMGYSAGCASPTVTGNYVATTTNFVNCTSGLSLAGNTFYGNITGFSPSAFPNNSYLSSPPTRVQVFVRPNFYEPGRANITVFNWARSAAVSVDLSELLDEGDEFVVRNAEDFFGPPVISGTYSGGSVEIPMEGLTVVPPIGYPSPASVAPDFGVFVVELLRPARSRPVRIPPSRSPVTLPPRRP